MFSKWRIFKTVAATLLFSSTTSLAYSDNIADDSFESGERSDIWRNLMNVEVMELPPETQRDGHGFRFAFWGKPGDEDSFAEARFDLGREYAQINIMFDLYIPENYKHRRPSSGTNNNKFFRLWQKDYGDIQKIGASMLGQGDGSSTIGSDYVKEQNRALSTAIKNEHNFITSADKGKWMKVRLSIRAPTASKKGMIRVFKNGDLFLEDNEVANKANGSLYRYGYLLGWANSGFDENTFLYVDNVVIRDELGSRPLPPMPR